MLVKATVDMVCPGCQRQNVRFHAKGLCRTCYQRFYKRKQRNEIKKGVEVSTGNVDKVVEG